MALHELQQMFREAILFQQTAAPDALREEGLSRDRRLDIYRNNVFSSLTIAMQTLFPVVRQLVGEQFFDGTVCAYVREHPPENGRLGEYGELFPAFLKSFQPARCLPYLPDVAKIELAWQRAYHAADADPLAPENLKRMAPATLPRLRFRPHPALQLLISHYPAGRIWKMCQTPVADESVDVGHGGDFIAISRPDTDVQVHLLTEGAYTLLRSLVGGATLLDGWESAGSQYPGLDFQTSFQTFLTAGFFTGFAVL